MAKTLTYFFAAVILVGGAKLVEVFFYDALKPVHLDKPHKEETVSEEPKKDKLDELIESTGIEADSTIQATELLEDPKFETSDAFSSDEGNTTSPEDSLQQTATTQFLTGEDYFQDLKNSYLSPLMAGLPEGRSREDVVIRYYKHANDGNKIYALRNLGYYLHEREAEDNESIGSNALYYGADVDPRDIKLVAYTLVKSGVPLKIIKKSAYDWKFNSLEIGVDSLAQGNAVLTISDIEEFESR